MLAVFVALAFVAGCGSSSSSDATTAAASGTMTDSPLTPVRVGAFPLTQLMLPYVAQDEGDFDAEKLDVKIEALSGSAVQEVPNVLSGKMHIGVSGLADPACHRQGRAARDPGGFRHDDRA
jgi:ABC-type nitrate/sulfonate/bicarbonate transport system substrate-binding protein